MLIVPTSCNELSVRASRSCKESDTDYQTSVTIIETLQCRALWECCTDKFQQEGKCNAQKNRDDSKQKELELIILQ